MFEKKQLILQYCRFAVVGIASFFVDYGFMVFLTENTALGYFYSCAFSYTLSVLVNYTLSMRYVFEGRTDISKMKEATIFFILSLFGLLLNQVVMFLAVDVFLIHYAAAKIISTLLVTNYNFISRKTFLE